MDNAIMGEVRDYQQNLAVAYYDYKKAHDSALHNWLEAEYMNGWEKREKSRK